MSTASVLDPDERVRLCTFGVGDEILAIDIMRIKEIVRSQVVTPVPKAPRAMIGVIDLRGKVVPLFDLRARFDLDVTTRDEAHERQLIVTVDGRLLGLIVDEVFEVVEVARRDLRVDKGVLAGASGDYFVGVFPSRGRLALLLNIRRLLSSDEAVAFSQAEALVASSEASAAGTEQKSSQ